MGYTRACHAFLTTCLYRRAIMQTTFNSLPEMEEDIEVLALIQREVRLAEAEYDRRLERIKEARGDRK